MIVDPKPILVGQIATVAIVVASMTSAGNEAAAVTASNVDAKMVLSSPLADESVDVASIPGLLQLETLRSLRDGWDSEGVAPAPTPSAIGRAQTLLVMANSLGLPIADVDADVLGGVSVWLDIGDRSVWISCMNSGSDTFVCSERGRVVRHGLREPHTLVDIAAFLRETDGKVA